MEAPSFTEEELISLYENLLAIPASARPDTLASTEPTSQGADHQCISTVQTLASRLLHDDSVLSAEETPLPSKSLAERLRSLRGTADAGTSMNFSKHQSLTADGHSSMPLHLVLIARIEEMLQSMESLRSISTSGKLVDPVSIPAGFIVEEEWKALTQYCLLNHDPTSAESVVDIMQRSGSRIPEETLDALLVYHIDLPNAEQVERIMQKYMAGAC